MDFNPEINKQIFQILVNVISVLTIVFATYAIKWSKNKIGVEKLKQIEWELENKKEIVLIGIKFVEQVYKDLQGEEKLNACLSWVTEQFNLKGFNFTENEIRGLIEGILRDIKDEFGEEWGKQVK